MVVSRERHKEKPSLADGAVVIKSDEKDQVMAKRVDCPNSGEVRLYCHSTPREKKDRAIRNRFAQRFEEQGQRYFGWMRHPFDPMIRCKELGVKKARHRWSIPVARGNQSTQFQPYQIGADFGITFIVGNLQLINVLSVLGDF